MNGIGKSRDVRSAIASSALMLVALGATGVLQAAEGASDADRISALEAQLNQQKAAMQQQQRMIEAMDAELKRLKTVEAPAATSTSVVATGQTPASAPAAKGSGSNKLSIDVYGFAQTDAIYDFKRVNPDWEDTLRVSTIPVQSGQYGNDGNFTFSVRQSRFGVKGGYGDDVTFKLEGELFGVGSDQGQTTLRLRHAYGTYKNFLMGQTWSNFMDIDIFPNTVDYWGPTGMVFYRNQQATYTFPMGDDLVSVGLEDPGTALTVGKFWDTPNCDLPDPPPDCQATESNAADVFQSYNNIPDLAARYRSNGDFGHYQVAGIVRKLGYERLDNGEKDYEIGWGINTSTALNTWGKDQLKLQVAYGKGIGNYMNDGGVDIAPDSADINQANAETVPLWGLSAYYDRYWSDKWSTSVGWSMTDLDTTNGQAPDEFKKGQIAQINLLYYPVDHVLMGPEFIWGQREDIDGSTGSDYRIQFTLKVDFDTGDLMRN
jgi:hypothetical protein